MKDIKKDDIAVVEALLFIYGQEVTFSRIATLLNIPSDKTKHLVKALQKEYDNRKQSGLRILIDDNKAQMVTHPDVAITIEKITKKELEGPLTPIAMEVLAIIAYRGPISKTDIETIRGVNCSFTLRNLTKRGLIECVKDAKDKRLYYYRTTPELLRVLGIKSVEELPQYKKIAQDKRIDAILYNEEGGND